MTLKSKQVVEQFWEVMQTNDFRLAGERIRGRASFVAVNENYPAHGRWEFTIHRILAEDNTVVSDVEVTDGVIRGRDHHVISDPGWTDFAADRILARSVRDACLAGAMGRANLNFLLLGDNYGTLWLWEETK